MLVEGVLLAAISGAAALILAAWSADLLSAFSLPSPIPQRLHFVLDARIVGFTLALVALAGVLPALIPALQASRSDVRQVMGSQPVIGVAPVAGPQPVRARPGCRVDAVSRRRTAVRAQLLERGVVRAGLRRRSHAGARAEPASFGYDAERAQGLFGSLVERLRGVPGIEPSALADRAPLSVGFPKTVDVAGDLDECSGPRCRSAIEFGISADHFAALGLPLRAGRELTEQEVRANAPVVVVGEGMAQTLWPERDPIGQSLRVGRERPAGGGRRRRGGRSRHVLGRDGSLVPLSSAAAGRVRRPRRRDRADCRRSRAVCLDRAPAGPGARSRPAGNGDQHHPGADEAAVMAGAHGRGLPAGLRGPGPVLATVGLFGVTFYTVSQRTREFGVRVALGATPGRVMALVLREGLMLTVPGVIVGIAGALLALRLASRMLVGVGPADPATYLVTALLQTAVALGRVPAASHAGDASGSDARA